MDNDQVQASAGQSDAVARRNLLKGAAAVGVGVAAWSAPSITAAQNTPTYAARCTAPIDTYEGPGSRNTACGGCGGDLKYKPLSTRQCPTGFPDWPGSIAVVDSNGVSIGNSGLCPGQAFVRVTGVPAGQFCRVLVIIATSNCGVAQAGASATFTGDATVLLPAVACTPPNNYFTRFLVECSDQSQCLSSAP